MERTTVAVAWAQPRDPTWVGGARPLGGRGQAPEAEACAGAGSCYHTRERRESSPDRASEACGAVIQETVGPTRSLAAFLPAGKGARGRHCSTAFSFFKIKISTGRHFQCILLIRESHKARFQVSGVHIRDGGGFRKYSVYCQKY